MGAEGSAKWSDEYGVPRRLRSAREIEMSVERLASCLGDRFAGRCPLLLGVLTGSYVFVADLSRRLEVPHRVAFVRASSYGDASTPQPEVSIEGVDGSELEGQDVVVVEDLIDSGHTLEVVVEAVRESGAATVTTCVLVSKERDRPHDVHPDLVGFVVPDVFVVGYGIDYRGAWRHLPELAWVDPPESPPPPTTGVRRS